jgi:hypothetical protein
LEATVAAGCKERGRERDGRLELGRRLLPVGCKEGERGSFRTFRF